MKIIRIERPGDIRLEVNKAKQLTTASNTASTISDSSAHTRHVLSHYGIHAKRRALSSKLVVDFGQCGLPANQKTIQAVDLATLIAKSPHRLDELSLEDVRVEGDFSLVTAALRDHGGYLRSFNSYSCRISNETQDLLALGVCLAEACPQLESIAFGSNGMRHQLVLALLGPIVQRGHASRLQKIFVNGFSLHAGNGGYSREETNQHVQAFFTGVQQIPTLQRLICLPLMSDAFRGVHMPHIAQLIQQNQPALTHVQLHLFDEGAFGAELDNNDFVTTLTGCAAALQQNTNLTRFSVASFGSNTSFDTALASVTAFHTCLKDYNFTIEDMPGCLPDQSSTWPSTVSGNAAAKWNELRDGVEFYLSLNRMGRARLLSPKNVDEKNVILATTDEWMDAIANKDDLSIIYYLLEKNPSLCLPSHDEQDHHDQTAASSTTSTSTSTATAKAAGRTTNFGNLVSPEAAGAPSFSMFTNKVAAMEQEYQVVPRNLDTEPQQDPPARKKRSRADAFGFGMNDLFDTDDDESGDNDNANDNARMNDDLAMSVTSSTLVERYELNNDHDAWTVVVAAVASPAPSPFDIVKNVAVYAATFAAGFIARGYVDQQY